MNDTTQIVLSASRRTDIPAFYMEWFLQSVERGAFQVTNPYNRRTSIIEATPDKVHSIVFWSKNFRSFIQNGYGRRLQQMGYHLFFNFSVNSRNMLLEPGVPSLDERLSQLDALCGDFDAKIVNWRFDPICFYQTDPDDIKNNLNDFNTIADRAAKNGITRCITSFMDDYAKIRKRIATIPQFNFIGPTPEEKVNLLLKLESRLTARGIDLQTCCEKKLLEALPAKSSITSSACIPNELLVELYGGSLSFKKDTGQRRASGCGCRVSIDIGSYQRHPCYHNCLFCYANPSPLKQKAG